MKLIIRSLLLIFAVAAISSCKGPKGEKAGVAEKKDVNADITQSEVYVVDTDASVIHWEGSKPTGEHHGTVQLKTGELQITENEITGGSFIIDLNSIVNEDIEDPEMNAKLVGHLKSPDFFHVDSFPVAEFEITSVVPQDQDPDFSHSISGNLTMKDITKNITFKANVEMNEGQLKATSNNFIIDRTVWNVTYGSKKVFDNLQDNFIHDEMGLKIELIANK